MRERKRKHDDAHQPMQGRGKLACRKAVRPESQLVYADPYAPTPISSQRWELDTDGEMLFVVRQADGLILARIVADRDERVAHAMAAAPEMLESLKDLMGLLDEGFLVRNTDLDAEPGFAMRMLGPMAKLKAALVVIDKAEGKENSLPVSKEGT